MISFLISSFILIIPTMENQFITKFSLIIIKTLFHQLRHNIYIYTKSKSSLVLYIGLGYDVLLMT